MENKDEQRKEQMPKFSFSNNSKNKLTGVHPALIECCKLALSYGILDFAVVQGARTEEQQAALYAQGRTKPGKIVTWTLKSNHLLQKDGYSHAVDLLPFVNGKGNWDDLKNFDVLASLMVRAAEELNLHIGWGGDWKKKDRPHFELLKGGKNYE